MANNNQDRSDSPPAGRPRQGSISSSTFSSFFGRSNSTAGSSSAAGPTPFPTAAARPDQQQRRRMSVTTLGLSGTSPIQPSPFSMSAGGRRASVSTAGSESIDENAIDDDEMGRSLPNTPFTRRMSFGAQALRAARNGSSPNSSGRASSYTTAKPLPSIRDTRDEPVLGSSPTNSQASMQSKPRAASDFFSARPGEGLNWSEQFRSRAESSVSQRPPPASLMRPHERTKSVTDMPSPPQATIPAPTSRMERNKPDAFGERMLKGDFMMD